MEQPETGAVPTTFANAPAPEPQTAHILLVDVADLSRLTVEGQASMLTTLREIVRRSDEFVRTQSRREVVCLPRAEGMALLFLRDSLSPVRCALQVASAARTRPYLRLRMGIHTGPVVLSADASGEPSARGDALAMAERIVGCGDAGHILLSSQGAEALDRLPSSRPCLTDLGSCEVGEGRFVRLFNLFTQELGNRDIPQKVLPRSATLDRSRARPEVFGEIRVARRRPVALWVAPIVVLAAVAVWFGSPSTRAMVQERLFNTAPPAPKATAKQTKAAHAAAVRTSRIRRLRLSEPDHPRLARHADSAAGSPVAAAPAKAESSAAEPRPEEETSAPEAKDEASDSESDKPADTTDQPQTAPADD